MTYRISALSLLALCGVFGALPVANAHMNAHMQEDGDKSPAFTIVGAHVFDGENWLPAGTQVRVQHGLVLAVGPDVGLARGGTIIDATGKTLLPEQLEAIEADAAAAGNDARNYARARSLAEKVQSGHGAIVTGAHADLRLVDGDTSQDWNGFGDVVARWKNGVLVGHRGIGKRL